MPRPIPPAFHCELVHADGQVRIAPRGELDISTVSRFERRLREALDGGAQRLVVDLRELDFMDSTGLTLLVHWGRRAVEDGYEIALVRGVPRVHRLFEITGLDSQFAFAEG